MSAIELLPMESRWQSLAKADFETPGRQWLALRQCCHARHVQRPVTLSLPVNIWEYVPISGIPVVTYLAANRDSLTLTLLDKNALPFKGQRLLLLLFSAHGFIIVPSATSA